MGERVFTDARREQGFRSQEHLDAFYRYYDHTTTCDECRRPGPPALAFGDLQPTRNICEEARRLDVECLRIGRAT